MDYTEGLAGVNNPARAERASVGTFLTRAHGGSRFNIADVLTYGFLFIGTLVMFVPVVWLVISSFKPEETLEDFPPTFLPYQQETAVIAGYDTPLNLYDVVFADGTQQRLAQVRILGRVATMIDPAQPDGGVIEVDLREAVREPVRSIYFDITNYTDGVQEFPFKNYLGNSVLVTAAATGVTLLINSMAAFGLSKYKFRGRDTIFYLMLSTLMVPVTVILIPAFLVVSQVGWSNSLLGVIIPGAATPTGVFLLRQYMLTLPDELLDSARIDGASEWRIFWQIVLPLSAPALAVLAIFSIMWRWNDFLWPKIVLSRTELFTLQVGLQSFQGELDTQWHYVLAMTVLTLLPITVAFAFLQRFITRGVATTGMK